MVFCPFDASPLVMVGETSERRERSSSLHCPRCRRAFAAPSRFCPFDAEGLVVRPLLLVEHHHDALDDGGRGRICPTCAARYGLGATFCGKDGSELMTVN
jgi:hypothetical protein